MLEQAGLICSGLSPDGRLVEFVELPRSIHPFFVATQAHPEFLSRPTRPHPLFTGLVAAARSTGGRCREPVTAAGSSQRVSHDEACGRAREPEHGARAGGSGPGCSTASAGQSSPRPSTPGAGRHAAHRPGPDAGRRGGRAAGGRAPGAVAVVALDEAGRVLLIRQYRHPVGRLLWEIPAGLRDVPGEPPLATAQRELLEETGYRARDWLVLADFFSSPGISTERIRVFLARGLHRGAGTPSETTFPRHEEAHLLVAWVPLEEAVHRFLAGDLHNGVAGVGILSAYAARQDGFAALRRRTRPSTEAAAGPPGLGPPGNGAGRERRREGLQP